MELRILISYIFEINFFGFIALLLQIFFFYIAGNKILLDGRLKMLDV